MHEQLQDFMRFVAGWSAFPDPVVALATYRMYWFTLIGELDTPYYDYFFLEMGFSQVDVEVLPGIIEEAVIWDISSHLNLNLFLTGSPDPDTLGCKYKETFFALPT